MTQTKPMTPMQLLDVYDTKIQELTGHIPDNGSAEQLNLHKQGLEAVAQAAITATLTNDMTRKARKISEEKRAVDGALNHRVNEWRFKQGCECFKCHAYVTDANNQVPSSDKAVELEVEAAWLHEELDKANFNNAKLVEALESAKEFIIAPLLGNSLTTIKLINNTLNLVKPKTTTTVWAGEPVTLHSEIK